VRRRQLNPRQRQGLLLVVIAAVGLLGVLLLIANYVSGVSKQVGPKISVLELTRPVAVYSTVSEADLGEVSLPEKWAPRTALRDPSQVGQLVAGTDLPSGTILQQGMLIAPPALTNGFREIAILVDEETGVAGQIVPGSKVDVVANYAGNNQGVSPSTQVVVSQVTVLGVGSATAPGRTAAQAPTQSTSGQNGGLPVTLLLTPGQVLKVSYAESFAQKVRLSLVAPGTLGHGPKLKPYQPSTP
jgi:pilus assembly protein CpaB